MTDWSEEKPTIELVRSLVTITDVLAMLDVDVNSSGKFASPWRPDERTPSAHDFGDHFWDFGAGKGGDVIDLVQAYQPDLPLHKVLWLLWTKGLRSGLEPGAVERAAPRNLVDFTEELAKVYRDPAGIRFYEAHLQVPIPANCVVGFNADVDADVQPLLIPHADQDGVYGVKVRGADGSKSAWPGSQFTKRLYCMYGWPTRLDGQWRECVITEGESDAWALNPKLPYGRIFALPSGAGSWKDHWLEDLEPFDQVWICMDNDRAGEQAREKLTSKIGHLRAEQLRVPDLFNDCRQAIAAGWRPNLVH